MARSASLIPQKALILPSGLTVVSKCTVSELDSMLWIDELFLSLIFESANDHRNHEQIGYANLYISNHENDYICRHGNDYIQYKPSAIFGVNVLREYSV